MIRVSVVIALLCFSMLSIAQTNVMEIQKEIDISVWRTFHDAFEQLDGVALNSVYADTVLRVTPAGVDTENAFKAFNTTRFQENKTNGDGIALDFWFDSRRTNESTSYEVGFYKIRISTPSGAASTFYGQFHIVLRKCNGQWKIVQDWDTDAIGGRSITAADFERQKPLEF